MKRLIRLDEASAIRTFLDAHNYRLIFRWLPLLAFVTVARLFWQLAMDPGWTLVVPTLSLVTLRLFYSWREHPLFERHFRLFLVLFLVAQMSLWRSLFWPQAFHFLDIVFPCLVLLFRLPTAAVAFPLMVAWSMAGGRSLVTQLLYEASPEQSLELLIQSLCIAGIFGLNGQWTRGLREQFLDTWRRDRRHALERHRMREELGDARRIQLSMLPSQPPEVPGLDLAGISIPASEVGGDYFDFFPLQDNLLVIVVADVAGHGVASGLVLSGIRSCLHLLMDAPPPPVTVLQKLDRVVRQTADRRHFVTMVYALFDLERRQVTVATAGHPPLLHWRRTTRDVQELGSASLPLGTPLKGQFQQRSTDFEDQDVFLLYSDGIAETCNDRTETYGNDRLQERLSAFAGPRADDNDLSARQIRDILLADIVQFKGDREQTDDITVVAARFQPHDD